MRPNIICCLGANHAGGLTSCVIASKCPEIRMLVADKEEIISEWNSNNSCPFNEPGLDQILKKCRHKNLFFTSDYASSIRDADMIFLPINVPIKSDTPGMKKLWDYKELEEAAKLVAAHSELNKIVVEQTNVSAVERISSILESFGTPGVRYQVISNPTNVNEGSAINDLLNPSCVLIGCKKNPNNKVAAQSLSELYEIWVPRNKIKVIDSWSATISFLAGNLSMAERTSSINGMWNICQESNADFTTITECLNKDSRLNTEVAKSSLGFGCYQKDLYSFILMCEVLKLTEVASYWQTILDMNSYQTKKFIDQVATILDPVDGKEIGILGFAQAKNSRETKYSPAIKVCEWLLDRNCKLTIFDPVIPAAQILQELETEFFNDREDRIKIVDNMFEVCKDTSAVILCTDWDEFKKIDFNPLFKPIFIDGYDLWKNKTETSVDVEYRTTH